MRETTTLLLVMALTLVGFDGALAIAQHKRAQNRKKMTVEMKRKAWLDYEKRCAAGK